MILEKYLRARVILSGKTSWIRELGSKGRREQVRNTGKGWMKAGKQRCWGTGGRQLERWDSKPRQRSADDLVLGGEANSGWEMLDNQLSLSMGNWGEVYDHIELPCTPSVVSTKIKKTNGRNAEMARAQEHFQFFQRTKIQFPAPVLCLLS